MLTVYRAANPLEASLVRDYLAEHGIEAVCLDPYAWGGHGELPATEFPRVAIRDAALADRARALIAMYERPASGGDWTCPGCGEVQTAAFALCWNCGSATVEAAP